MWFHSSWFLQGGFPAVAPMNFLAHAWLAGELPADRVGALAGDFVKGNLPAGLPADIAEGVRLHRRIDVFADSHPAFLRSRARIPGIRRRVSGIMVDMFYDHFMARHWGQFCDIPLAHFAAKLYALLEENLVLLPPAVALVLPVMRDNNWLCSYRSPSSVSAMLDQMALRMRHPGLFSGSGVDLLGSYSGFEMDFFDFIPAAQHFAAGYRANRFAQ